jgi:glucose-1-phosphate adenylyltransferase
VLTQFNSVSLHRHIYNTYKFDSYGAGFVEILAAQQTMEHESWYQGTADAVRRNIPYFTENAFDLVLILSGDQLYRMDFQDMIRTHLENKAAITIAALPVAESEAKSCGIMRIQADGRVLDFEEKPKTPEKLDRVRTDVHWLEKLGLRAVGRPYLASMGIYLFNRVLLVDLLRESKATDFGHELLPQTIASHRVQAHLFDGYWEDIGTVGAFHQANVDLTRDDPRFDFATEAGPIFTRARFLSPSRIIGATMRNSLLCDGCSIGRGSVIENSVIGVRARIAENVTIRDTYIMGIDFPETQKQLLENQRQNRPPIGIGANTVIERAIIDKNARIGRNARIINQNGTENSEEHATFVIRDHVVVIPKDAVVVDGSVI